MPPKHTHSEEMEQIMGNIPGWIVRWGIIIIFLVFASILVVSSYIRYPDTVSVPVTLTTQIPPADLIAGTPGRIVRVFVKEGDTVSPGQPVALVGDTAGYALLLRLEDRLKTGAPPGKDVDPDGLPEEVQAPWLAFLNKKGPDEGRALQSAVRKWKREHLLRSPAAGTIVFSGHRNPGRILPAGERLASVLPPGPATVLGQAFIPAAAFTKVKPGQPVTIKLHGYPYTEYGLLKGTVASVASLPQREGYAVEIALPQGLVSTYGTALPYVPEMKGQAEIVLHDTRLLDRFLQPLRSRRP